MKGLITLLTPPERSSVGPPPPPSHTNDGDDNEQNEEPCYPSDNRPIVLDPPDELGIGSCCTARR